MTFDTRPKTGDVRWVKLLALLPFLLLAALAYILIATVLDALFGWGIAAATRDFVGPIFPAGSDDPGDCDPYTQVC